jgi:uncharacterized protein
MALYAGYGNNIRLDRGDSLIAYPSENGRVVTLEYEVHGKVLATDTPHDNRFVSIATIENRKIVRWRDYMDSLTAWRGLTLTASIPLQQTTISKRRLSRLDPDGVRLRAGYV